MKPVKIAKNHFLKPLRNLRIGEKAWIRYESMFIDANESLYVEFLASTSQKRIPNKDNKDGFLLEVKRVEEGIIAYYSGKHYKWEWYYNDLEQRLVVPVVAKTDKEYEYKKKNPSLEDLEHSIDAYSFELACIENDLNLEDSQNSKTLASRARNCRNKINALKIKKEEILKKKELLKSKKLE